MTTKQHESGAPRRRYAVNPDTLAGKLRIWIAEHPHDIMTDEDAARLFGVSVKQAKLAIAWLQRDGACSRRMCFGAPKAFELGS